MLLVLGTAITVVISRSLGPSQKGQYDIVLLIMNTAATLVLVGFGSANVYMGARQRELLPALTGNSIAAGLLFGGIALVSLELLTYFVPFQDYLSSNHISLTELRWIAVLLPVILIYTYLRDIVRAAGNIAGYTMLNVIQTVINLANLIVMLMLLDRAIQGAIEAWVISQIATATITLIYVLRLLKQRPSLDWALFKNSMAFGMRLHVGNIAQFLNYRLDVLLVSIILTPVSVGLYTTATGLAERIWDIPAAIRTPLLYHASARPESAAQLTARLCRVIATILGLICLFLVVAGTPLIQFLYGKDFLPAVPAIMLLLPGVWSLGIGKLVAIHLTSMGRPEVGTWAALASLAATIILDVILIPKWGISGAAVASSAAYTISTAVVMHVFRRTTGIHIFDLVIMKREDWTIVRAAFDRSWQRLSSRVLKRYDL